MMTVKKLKVISLFSGGMGLDLGLKETARYELLACVEKVPAYCDTIRLNRDAGHLPANLKIYEGDISNIDPYEVLAATGLKPGELDVLVGGPPCQSFSTAGNRGTVQDPRGTLLWQFLKFVEVMQPKFFVMENVRGLISAALRHRPIADRPPKGPELSFEEMPGSVMRLFSQDLQKLKNSEYHLDVFEVNSVNYGAPQIRERVLFIGNRFGAQVAFPDPTHGPSSEAMVEEDLFSKPLQLKRWKTLGDVISDLDESDPEMMDFSPRKKGFLSLVPEGSNWRSLPEEIQKESMGKAWHAKGGRSGWWRRLTMELPCPTLVTMPNHSSTSLCHPVHTRALTVREYARIQEFPDYWQFSGKTADKYAQIGNAVPVRLGAVAGLVIAECFDLLEANGWKPLERAPEAFRIVYIQSHVRTRRWFKDGKTIVWDKETDDADYGKSKTKRLIRSLA